jgi:hypothetical protein
MKIFNKIYYISNDGEVYQCVKGEEKKYLGTWEELQDEIKEKLLNNIKNKESIFIIHETQVKFLKESYIENTNIDVINFYKDYKLITEEEVQKILRN